MSIHTAVVSWTRAQGDDFPSGRYSRAHEWRFDGGHVAPASPQAGVIPAALCDPAGVDPEEAFVAALSSCHMLYFLYFAQRAGFVIETYTDSAEGELGKRADGRAAMTRVTLRPDVGWGGDKRPSAEELADINHKAHEACVIANSVTTEIVIQEPAVAS